MDSPLLTSAAPEDPLRARFDDALRVAPSADELDWYAARLPRDGTCLDAMCGSGRLLVPLARRGFAIQGADASAAALALASARLASAGRNTLVYRQALVALNLPTRYGAAILDGAAFLHIADPKAARAALERLRAHLFAAGLLIVDAHVPSFAGSRFGAPLVEWKCVALDDGSQIRMRSETSVDSDARLARTDARYTHRKGAQALGEAHARGATTWYTGADLAELLVEAGWHDVAEEASPVVAGEGETRYVVTARA
ncbi:MAG: methyltransferase domain-containing protein [Betaproteobacteria bacterium]